MRTSPLKASTRSSLFGPSAARFDPLAAITKVAFVLAIAAVAARVMLLESIREPFSSAPGTTAYPLGPGSATSLTLDLICALPAILVLLRRVLDKTYVLRWSWSQLIMLPMTLWLCASVWWADDKFAAIISAANFTAAMCLLWAASQLVRSWLRLRVIAGLGYGLLLACLVQGYYYKLVDGPATVQSFEANSAKVLHDRGLTPGSFAAHQFEQKIRDGEILGFNSSENSFAAVLVLLTVLTAGGALQRLMDGDDPGWALVLGAAIPLSILLIGYTHCKAAIALPVLAAILLTALWYWRTPISRFATRMYWLGVAAMLLAIAALIGHGLYHHSLPTDSLNFRWRYWVASWQMFLRRPLLGTGWENFGPHYLRDRLPAASEEIRDPHDFVVRFFVELGAVGGVLLIAWLLRLWWELTRPVLPAASPIDPLDTSRATSTATTTPAHAHGSVRAMGWIFAAAIVAMVINTAASVDFTQDVGFVGLEVMKRLMLMCALCLGIVAVTMRSLKDPSPDERPAPWILYGLLVAVGMFLIHNLIEFSLFETGNLCLIALLIGSALGIRHPSRAGQKRHTPVAIAALLVSLGVWITVALMLLTPVALAESTARTGDAKLRAGDYEAAATSYTAAHELVGYNADYAFRAGQSLHYEAGDLLGHGDPLVPPDLRSKILAYYGMANHEDPSNLRVLLARAALSSLPISDSVQATADYDKALELNPNDVSVRLEYARVLAKLSLPLQAVDQLQLAMQYNDKLDAAEPKRLTSQEVAQIRAKIVELSASR